MPDFDELERLARAATPGPWKAFFATNGSLLGVGKQDGKGVTDYRGGLWGMEPEANANAAFIAAANPATILALLSANREMRASLKRIAYAEADGLDLARDSMVLERAIKIARSALTTQRGDGE